MEPVAAVNQAAAPLVALGIVAVLVLLLRWAFASGKSLVARPGVASDADNYGLLTPVSGTVTRASAEEMLVILRRANIRATAAQTHEGLRILVFAEDLEVAQRELGLR